MKKSILIILSITILLLAWQLLAMLVRLPDLVPSVPRLLSTLAALFASGSFYQSVMATVLRGTIGMSISLMAAVGVSFLFYKCEWMYELFRPLLAIMRAIPVISFILLALIFLNAESIPLIIAFLTMFPLLTENLTKGIRSRRKELSIMARQFKIGRWNRLTQVTYPQLKPFLYSGLVSALGFGWRAIIMGEVLAQCSPGIGGEMKQAQVFIAVPELIAWTVIAILISYLLIEGSAGWRSDDSPYIITNIVANCLCQKGIAIYGFVIFHTGMVRIKSYPISATLSKRIHIWHNSSVGNRQNDFVELDRKDFKACTRRNRNRLYNRSSLCIPGTGIT